MAYAESGQVVRLSNAGVKRQGRWIVRHLDMNIKKGEIVTLVGLNGSGKTTTAKMILGVHSHDEGEVWRKSGLRVGYVPQRLSLDWAIPLTSKRFMSLTGKLASRDMEEAMSRVNVLHLQNQEIQSLSGGEFQRLLLARAIARKPQLLVLDEPVEGVDLGGEIALYRLIAELRDELTCSILMISHDLHIVMAATDRIICLNGHICCEGTPQSVAEHPEFLSLFGRTSASSLAVYEHHHDHEHAHGYDLEAKQAQSARSQNGNNTET